MGSAPEYPMGDKVAGQAPTMDGLYAIASQLSEEYVDGMVPTKALSNTDKRSPDNEPSCEGSDPDSALRLTSRNVTVLSDARTDGSVPLRPSPLSESTFTPPEVYKELAVQRCQTPVTYGPSWQNAPTPVQFWPYITLLLLCVGYGAHGCRP